MPQSSKTQKKSLNRLQNKVLLLSSEGLSYSDIESELGLSEHSIVIILSSVLDTMEARNVHHAIALQFHS